MNLTSSTAAHLPLPGWAYVPGETADAEPDHEALGRAKALVPAQFFGHVPTRHPALRYGMALNDAGYFWEAQEVLEAVWAAAPQRGRERILLRACIQIANANLKLRILKAQCDRTAVGRSARGNRASGAPVARVRRRFCRPLPGGPARQAVKGPSGAGDALQIRLDRLRLPILKMQENADLRRAAL